MHFRGFGQGRLPVGVSPRKAPEQNRSFQRLWPGVPQERLQHKLVIPRKCLSEALAGGSPQERLQNKILITRKSSRAAFLLPGNDGSGHRVPQERHQKKIVFIRKFIPEALAGDPAQEKAQEQDCYYLEMPSRGLARESPQERL